MLLTVLVALFVWWFSTGAIFWAVSRGAGRAEVLLSAPTAAVSAYGLVWAADFGTPTGALMGFGCAIVVWGWFELAFLTGVITGPNKRVCPPGLNGHRHFLMAWGTLAHHELALLGTAIGLGAAVWQAPDHTGLWTFLILFAARISAKLNVYLGVPNLSHDLMPDAVAHMKTYFAKKRMNWLFPISVTVMSGALAFWAGHAAAIPGDPTGYTLLAALTGLALIEHWLMVLPVRDQALWQWMTKSRTNAGPAGAKPADDG